jgi:hypothetical protein
MPSDPVVPGGILGPPGGVSPAREGVASPSPLEPVVTGDGGAGSGGVGDSPVRGTLVQRGSAVEERQAHNLEVAGAIPAPVTKPGARSAALLQRIDDRIRRRATGIVSAALRAPELPEAMAWVEENQDKKVPPPGWTNRQLKVAADALASKPAFYLTAAMRIVESYKKTDAPVAPVLNAQLIQVNVTNTNVYPVRKVRDE